MDMATSAGDSRPQILIVEDEWLVAEDFEHALREADFAVVGPASNFAKALEYIEGGLIDGALIDVNLGEGISEALARALEERNIPFAVVTGYDVDDLPSLLSRHPVVNKPVGERALPQLVSKLLEKATDQPRG